MLVSSSIICIWLYIAASYLYGYGRAAISEVQRWTHAQSTPEEVELLLAAMARAPPGLTALIIGSSGFLVYLLSTSHLMWSDLALWRALEALLPQNGAAGRIRRGMTNVAGNPGARI